jgi:hypothetical protein
MSDETRDSLTATANAAFRQAAAKVIEQAQRTGTSVIVWEHGCAVERTWEEMKRELAKKSKK